MEDRVEEALDRQGLNHYLARSWTPPRQCIEMADENIGELKETALAMLEIGPERHNSRPWEEAVRMAFCHAEQSR